MSADYSQWPMGARPKNDTANVLVTMDQRLTERALLLAMCKRLSYALTSVQLIGSADDRRAKLCAEARALVNRIEGKAQL